MPAMEMTVGVHAPNRKDNAVGEFPESTTTLRAKVDASVRELVSYVDSSSGVSDYETFERELVVRIFAFARLLIGLFLAGWEEKARAPKKLVRGRARFRRQPPKLRRLGSFFGKVPFWRSYLYQTNGRGGGFYPVDDALGLAADGFSFGVMGRAVALATKMSYAAAAMTMEGFLGWAPSTTTIERSTLGLGRHTSAWFEQAPPPDEDGDILIVQIDSKATPTATEEELTKRRGKREPNSEPESARHRGRTNRGRRGSKKRRKKGDKSKNGKATTLLAMYTLRTTTDHDGKLKLVGPINRRIYGSYAAKRHAVAIARREADKRGFAAGSGKTIQVLTDGDEDLERYIKELFPDAIHTPDVIHVVEYIWKAASCLYPEGTSRLSRWVAKRKEELYGGHVWDMLERMNDATRRIRSAKTRERYGKYLDYIIKRAHRMNYAELAAQDLELSTGMIEGAVRYVVSQRFDEGGMRWIKERAEALLQLRCIQINGDWDPFVAFAQQRTLAERAGAPPRLGQNQPESLPTFGLAA